MKTHIIKQTTIGGDVYYDYYLEFGDFILEVLTNNVNCTCRLYSHRSLKTWGKSATLSAINKQDLNNLPAWLFSAKGIIGAAKLMKAVEKLLADKAAHKTFFIPIKEFLFSNLEHLESLESDTIKPANTNQAKLWN